ncbi:MAG: hypothetical protein VX899_21000 [Myxococcota bacterium]|nr:hypothetical protein [Myxococcota bacterium]
MKKLIASAALLSLASCATAPEKIPDHTVYADEADALDVKGDTLTFAIVGNVRAPVPVLDKAGRKGPTEGVSEDLVQDLRRRVDRQQLDFVTLMGDNVRWSTTKEWKAFDSLWQEVLDGQTVPTTEGYRIPTLPVVGDVDRRGDGSLQGVYGAFPDIGVDIGHARVASWYAFDVRVDGVIWRFVVLDSNKEKLGSRWNEQLYWIPEATEGRFDHMLVFMHDPMYTLAQGTEPNADDAPRELIEAIEDTKTGLFKIRAVISAEPHASEVILPDGPGAAAHITAGGGGAPGETLDRYGNLGELGENVALDPLFDMALLEDFKAQAQAKEFPEDALEHATATGSWEGFTGAYDARYYPTYGYWMAELSGEQLELVYHHYADGSFEPLYGLTWTDAGRWKSSKK